MPTLLRVLVILFAGGVLLAAGGGLLWYLAYGVDHGPPEQQVLASLHARAGITWGRQGNVSIQASDEHDAVAALGYAHGWQRAWSVALWRQAAVGRLGEWFGEPALPVDRLARRLRLAAQAYAAYHRLGEEEQALLRAYTGGLNAALRSPARRLQQEFVLLNVEPEPWQPWHTLAVERLFAWLAVPPPAPAFLARAGAGVKAFYEADQTLRQWLRLHGFENSAAWAAQDSAGTRFFQRHVYGATALPFLLEVSWEGQDGTMLQGATLPGTPFFPAGKDRQRAWALLMTGTAILERVPWDSTRATLDYERIVLHNDAEHLAAFWRLPERLPLEEPAAPASVDTAGVDSVWTLRWAGLTTDTDVPAWRALRTGAEQPFRLLRGDGLAVEHTGAWRVLGAPAIDVRLPAGIFVGGTFWSAYAAELLRTQGSGPVNLQAWIDDAYSIWAAQVAPPLINALAPAPAGAATLGEALTYLRNWDFSYDRASIAASIFDTWIARYRDSTGVLPAPAAQDTLPSVRRGYNRTLAQAVDTLTRQFGTDLSQWRWERVRPDRRLFPIWSVDRLRATQAGMAATARYAPLELPGHGHPSSLAWGTSPVQNTLPAPAMWEAWVQTDTWDAFTLRRRGFDPNAPLGRYLITERPPDPFRLPAAEAAAPITTLTPRSP